MKSALRGTRAAPSHSGATHLALVRSIDERAVDLAVVTGDVVWRARGAVGEDKPRIADAGWGDEAFVLWLSRCIGGWFNGITVGKRATSTRARAISGQQTWVRDPSIMVCKYLTIQSQSELLRKAYTDCQCVSPVAQPRTNQVISRWHQRRVLLTSELPNRRLDVDVRRKKVSAYQPEDSLFSTHSHSLHPLTLTLSQAHSHSDSIVGLGTAAFAGNH
jgi:hypothetical protein